MRLDSGPRSTFTNTDFRGGADQCIKAVLEAVKGLI